MIARAVLRILTEAYSDEFLATIPDTHRKYVSGIIERAKKTFRNPKQLNWFLRSRKSTPPFSGRNDSNPYASMGEYIIDFEHYFSLPIEAIHNFSFGSLSYREAADQMRGIEKTWQERAKRLIPIDKAYAQERLAHPAPKDIVKFPDGFRWVNLNVPYSEIEAGAMGHCGNEPRRVSADKLLSLRQLVKQDGEEYMMPHATFVLAHNGYLRELKGFQNHKLAPKYMRYVLELFKQYHRIHGIDNRESYRPESDVTWEDFTSEQLKDILRSNPKITDPIPKIVAGSLSGEFVIREETQGFKDGTMVYRVIEGDRYWLRDGKKHREDGPAVEKEDGTKEWWRNGKLHRDDGPAIEWKSGGKMWYRNGLEHRDDGPAVEFTDGTKEWYRNGKLHRDDGPAVMSLNPKYNQWYRDGHFYHPTDEEVARYEEQTRHGEITE